MNGLKSSVCVLIIAGFAVTSAFAQRDSRCGQCGGVRAGPQKPFKCGLPSPAR